jgi:hypothetical protein
MNQKL